MALNSATEPPPNLPDVTIEGRLGFFFIVGSTPKGLAFVKQHVTGAEVTGIGFTDQTMATLDIAQAAYAEGLSVTINDRKYIGGQEDITA